MNQRANTHKWQHDISQDALRAENEKLKAENDKFAKIRRSLIKENSQWHKRYIEAVNDIAELKRKIAKLEQAKGK